MSYLHLTSTRTRERTPDYDTYYTRPLVRRDSNKRRHSITLSDLDDADDYPYSTNQKPAKLSRALTVRDQPSQLERYNVVTDNRHNHNDAGDDNNNSRLRDYETRRTYRYSSDRPASSEPEDRDFHLSVNAKFGRPHPSHDHHHHHHHQSSSLLSPTYDAFHRSEKRWVDERWESRERSISRERSRTRRDSFWGDSYEEKERETGEERWRSYSRIGGREVERESIRPLSGWRRKRIVVGDD
ncbi:hypothetical protein G6011_05498 [Alternaria panax]|uniref:Uncharacterized protein n=1 Tax=Alternaria panax TaxID=48097 RepID=A0AAD4FCP0_9PLEO|nr:hypothetical protein G6011_05498 [Alternaria panax]